MKKFALTIIISVAYLSNSYTQESYINLSDRKLLDRGIELHRQNKYAVSTKYITNFINTASPESKHLHQEAEYYIACNAYQTKSKDAFNKLEHFVNTYPYCPMISRIYFMLGKMHYDKKEYAETLKYYRKIKNSDLKNDESNEYLYSRGYSHLVMKEYKSASYYFLPLSAKNQPFEVDATYYYGYSEFCLKHYDNSLQALEKIQPESKYYEPTNFHILQIYDRKNNHKMAIDQGEKLIKEFPNSKYRSEAFRILGESSYRHKSWAETINYLSKYTKLEKIKQRSNLYMLGFAYYKDNNFSAAINTLGKVTTENDSISQNAYLYIGYSNLELNQLKNAQMAFQSASLIDHSPKLREEATYNYTIAAYQNNSPFGETVAAFERFINEYPNSNHLDAIYSYMASVYMNEKDYHSALNSINKISTKNSKIRQAKENALFQIGVNYFINNKYEEALNYFDLSIKEYTPASFSAQAFLWRGETYFKLDKKTKCEENIITFLSKTQKKSIDDHVKAYYTLGYIEFEDKNYNDAQKWFSKLCKINGADRHRLYADVLNRLADCHYNKRDFEAARRVYASVNPKSPVADYASYQNAFILGLQKQYTGKINALKNLISKYRYSSYKDDALYEIGRTYVILENYDEAIVNYTSLQNNYTKSPLARKASLEIGMLYANMNKKNQAISAFKYVIEKYPSSEETRVALESLQSLYVELNKVDDYLNYRESIAGTTISNIPESKEDSLSFLAAQLVFEKGSYNDAIQSLNMYLVKYCDGQTMNCITATFYLAECHYALGNMKEALKYYSKVINKDGNPHMETSLLKGAEIAYDSAYYTQANEYFTLLYETAELTENVAAAIIGQLRCNYKLNDHLATINTANTILSRSSRHSSTHIREARYCRAKSYIASEKPEDALNDLITLSEEVQYEIGSEAMVLHANYLYEIGNYDQAEKIIANFIDLNSPHQYWIARSFILLADIYIAKKDDFMAKQYLMSLKENYSAKDDDIDQMIKERMNGISERETETVI